MLTLEDCIAFSDLTPEEVSVIAEHMRLPEVIAAEIGCYLAHRPEGQQALRTMIGADIDAACSRGDFRHAAKLKLVLEHFISHCRSNPALCTS